MGSHHMCDIRLIQPRGFWVRILIREQMLSERNGSLVPGGIRTAAQGAAAHAEARSRRSTTTTTPNAICLGQVILFVVASCIRAGSNREAGSGTKASSPAPGILSGTLTHQR